jgi:hypothetical protein
LTRLTHVSYGYTDRKYTRYNKRTKWNEMSISYSIPMECLWKQSPLGHFTWNVILSRKSGMDNGYTRYNKSGSSKPLSVQNKYKYKYEASRVELASLLNNLVRDAKCRWSVGRTIFNGRQRNHVWRNGTCFVSFVSIHGRQITFTEFMNVQSRIS